MLIGKPHFFSRDHYEAHRGVAPAYLCELVVHCLELVGQLVRTGLGFRFKGGNSQLILLERPERFSIDVDIVTTASKQQLVDIVQRIADECDAFTRAEVRQHKTKPWLPMISFKIFFESCYRGPDEAYVMLDAVLEAPPYAGVHAPIRCGDLYHAEEQVEVPAISGLIADKLLCIGPSTMGIPLGKNKEAQRLKHVFDVALLSSHPHEIDHVAEAMGAIMEQENRIQNASWSAAEVIADTREFVSLTLRHDERPGADMLSPGTYLDEIARGFDGFREHLFRAHYTWARLQGDCTRILGLLDALEGARP